MNKFEEIKKLIDIYFEGETTLEQEEELRNYFTSDSIADDLKQYQAIFGYFADKRKKPQITIDTEDDAIINAPIKTIFKRRKIIGYTISGIAASIVLFITILLFSNQQNQTEDIFCEGTYVIINGKCTDDPQKVSEVGIDAIDAILQPITEVEREIDNLINNNINTINKHLYFLEQLEIKN